MLQAPLFMACTPFCCLLDCIIFLTTKHCEKESDLLFLNAHKQIVNKPSKLSKALPAAVVTQAELSHHRQMCRPPVSCASIQLLFSPPKIYCGKMIVGLIADRVELVGLECVFGQHFVRSVKKQQRCKHRG